MYQAGETGRTIERFMLVGETLPTTARLFRFFFLTGSSPGLYACFTAGVWTPLFSGAGAGAVVLGGNTEPLDASIIAGQAILWFDPTNGASSLNVKAKENDGTVVKAQIFTS